MEKLTKNQAGAASQEVVQNQNEPQLHDEIVLNDKSGHGVLNPKSQGGFREYATPFLSWVRKAAEKRLCAEASGT